LRLWISNFHRLMRDIRNDRITHPSPSAVAERMPKWWRIQSPRRAARFPSPFAFRCATFVLAFRRLDLSQLLRIKNINGLFNYSHFDKRISSYISRFVASLTFVQSYIICAILVNVISNCSREVFLIFQHYVLIFIILLNDSVLNKDL